MTRNEITPEQLAELRRLHEAAVQWRLDNPTTSVIGEPMQQWAVALRNAAPALLDAADERAALRAENERLREALEMEWPTESKWPTESTEVTLARAALAKARGEEPGT